ncbi:MAG: hypothetical protein QM493_07940 [Sulfurovum sp.]
MVEWKLFNIGDSEKNYKILEQLIEKNSITGVIKDDFITTKNINI